MAALLMTPLPIDADRVRAAVERHGFDWHYRETTESTNVDVLNHFARHRREVVAFGEAQSAGRGRRGRHWVSPFAQNIYCTVGIRRALPARYQGLLSIVTGLALRAALAQASGVEAGLKWPNDILHGGRKLGGILIEARPVDEDCYFFAIGFGLNVAMDAAALAEIPTAATSLAEIGATRVDRSALLIALLDAVIDAIRAFEPAAVDALIGEFRRHDAFHDQLVEVTHGGQTLRGVNRGIDPGGQLRLETENGIELHSAAEISLRPAT